MLLLVLAAILAAQQPRIDETIEVSIVNVDVMVTDRQGNRVTGLTAADFEIREDGKLQPLTNFAEYAPASGAAGFSPPSLETGGLKPAAPQARQPRIIVIFLEAVRMPPFRAKEMIDAIRDLLRKSVAPGDRVTIATWRRGMQIRQPFTDDLAALETVLAKVETEIVHGPRDDGATIRALTPDGDSSMSSLMPTEIHALDAAKRQRVEIRQKAAALEALMHSISAADGRKIVLMGMKRFGNHAGVEYTGGEVTFDRRRELDTTQYRDSLIRTANTHGITLYTLYSPGLLYDPQFPNEPSPQSDLLRGSLENNIMLNETTALQDVAVSTGGLMAWGSANIAELLPRVAGDLDSYYSLGYRSRATGKDVSRRIVVTTKNPDHVVRSRRQVVEKSDESRMHDRAVANLYQQIPGATLPFEVRFGEPKSSGRKLWTMMLRIRIPVASLTVLPGERSGEFSVYVVTGGAVGVMSDVQQRTQPFRLTDVQRAKDAHFTYDLELRVDENVDRVSVAVMDEGSKEFGLKRIALPARVKSTP